MNSMKTLKMIHIKSKNKNLMRYVIFFFLVLNLQNVVCVLHLTAHLY